MAWLQDVARRLRTRSEKNYGAAIRLARRCSGSPVRWASSPPTCTGYSRPLAASRQHVGTAQQIVTTKLQQDWSPQQISAWLKDQYPGDPEIRVSHETIYRSLFVQARGALKKELVGHLRSRRRIRRPRGARDGRMGERILDALSIGQRPAEAADRAVPGHWEGDLVEGSRGTYIATMVERRSRCVILVKTPRSGLRWW